MKNHRLARTVPIAAVILFLFFADLPLTAQNEPINILVIGAHPDDADLCAGGTAVLWAQMGHRVKFVSLTNGDAGHQSQGGGALAKRRRAEAQEVSKRLGIAEYEVLDNHDGELIPSLDVRLQVIRQIRNWNADVVILPRPNDYHPDHRNTGLVVQDAAYMVIVPNVASDTPPLKKNPVFLYCQDRFEKPNPFDPEISVNIDGSFEQKIDGLDAHVSQFYEWLPWTSQALAEVPENPDARKEWLATNWSRTITDAVRKNLTEWYGTAVAAEIKQAESFEICEYGQQPGPEEVIRLFPMLQRPTQLEATFHNQGLRIDGRMNETVYDRLEKHHLWNSLTGKAVNDPDYKTEIYLFHDREQLYVTFKCYDKDIYSTFKNRDDHLWKEEVVEIFIDADQDPNTYFELEVSPAGVLFDSYITDPENIDLVTTPQFDFKDIQYAVSVDGTLGNRRDEDRSWTVEIAIPLVELVEQSGSGNDGEGEYKINFYRINTDGAPVKYQAWRPTFGSFHKPMYFGTLEIR